jgi:transposase
VPPNRAVNNQGDGRLFERNAFTYDKAMDSYQCPAGKALSLKQHNSGTRLYAARAEDCANCPLKAKCTEAVRRHISRHDYEDAFARMEQRLKAHPEIILMRHFSGARAEMALAVQAYNLKRAIAVLGAARMIELLA